MRTSLLAWSSAAVLVTACGSPMDPGTDAAVEPNTDGAMMTADTGEDAGMTPLVDGGAPPVLCTSDCEANAGRRLGAITGDPLALANFIHAIPKGGDLHNHLTGAVYAETYLTWAMEDHDCINSTTFTAVFPSSCGAATMAVPTDGAFYDNIIRAWSMQGFVATSGESGHSHFFATFAKYGAVAGSHRDDDVADVLTRAATENQLYLETMFNLGTHVGDVSEAAWTAAPGSMTAADIPTLYASSTGASGFAAAVVSDASVVRSAAAGYRTVLGCGAAGAPDACNVEVRFIAQVARTGPNDTVFGQLISAFEMARSAPQIVGLNLSSPEDDSRSLHQYALQMAMLDFLHMQYSVPGISPLHVTLHAGELTAAYLPPGSTDNTFHIRDAVELGHAERIGHGIDVMSETNASALMDEMHDRNVLVEVCLSSNDQILEVSGAAHPLAQYLAHGVPVALATDDQGVSRSSLAGEYVRGVVDQHLTYRQLKTISRNSLEHSFLPGASLWTTFDSALVSACSPMTTTPSAACQTFLDGSERAAIQWELERRFVVFESQQIVTP